MGKGVMGVSGLCGDFGVIGAAGVEGWIVLDDSLFAATAGTGGTRDWESWVAVAVLGL